MTDARAGSSPGSQTSAPPHGANCGKSAKQKLESQLGGRHGEQWLEVPWLSTVPGGLRSWASPMPGAGGQLKQASGAEHNPVLRFHPRLPCQLPLSCLELTNSPGHPPGQLK